MANGMHIQQENSLRFSQRKKCPIIIGLDIHNPQHFLTEENLNRALSVVAGLDLNFVQDIDLVGEAKKRKLKFY